MNTTPKAYAEKLALERGYKIAPPDHPIYSEGSSIMLLRRTPKASQGKTTSPKGSRKTKG